MKALIIADDPTAIERFSAVLKDAGYDIIVYHWLVKAIDNIEEIAPHIILVSAVEYPRHWKTLTQYAESGISGIIPQIILFTDKNFSEDEQKKAAALKVRGWFTSYDVDGLDNLRKILKKGNDIYEGTLDVPDSDTSNTAETPAATTDVLPDSDAEQITVADVAANVTAESDAIESAITQPETAISEIVENTEKEIEPAIEAAAVTETDVNETKPASDADNAAATSGTAQESVLVPEAKIVPEEKNTENNCTNVSFIFTNPADKTYVTGTVVLFDGKKMDFKPDYPVTVYNKTNNIQTAVIKVGDKISFVHAKMLQNNTEMITLQILAKNEQ